MGVDGLIGWMEPSSLERPGSCIYAHEEPWGMLHLPCTRSFLGAKQTWFPQNQPRPDFSVSQTFLVDVISPMYGLQILQIRCLDYVARNYLQLW
jgi:hypothetical protein